MQVISANKQWNILHIHLALFREVKNAYFMIIHLNISKLQTINTK